MGSMKQMIEDRADKLMKGEYNPFIKTNIMEAVCELTDDQYEQIAQAYSSRLPSVAGSLIGTFIEEFWQEQANKEAEELIQSEYEYRAELREGWDV